ncbi:MAG: UvrD-helicase domain-containing protein [Candidatus Binataceae bacterium]
MSQVALEEMFYWRPRILNAIRTGRHAIIEASAGTGKTFTIEHLLINLLLTTPATIDQILVVTFTEKATSELRARIRRLIEELVRGSINAAAPADHEKAALDGEALKRLEGALSSFDRAPISTIHGFCQRVLTELAFLTGTRFDLKVVDAGRAFHQAFRAELREHFAVEDPTRSLLYGWLKRGDKKSDIGELENLLLKAHQRHYLEPDPDVTRDEIARHFTALFHHAALAAEYRASGLRNKMLINALEALDKLDKITAKAGGSITKLFAALSAFDFNPLLRAKAAQVANADANNASRKPAGLSEFLCVVTDLQLAASIESNADEARETALVEAFLPAVAARLDRQKREQGHIDYEDMLLWVDRAIAPPAGDTLVNALRDRFLYGLVDEFQDTDDLQWRIFRRIFVDSPGANRLFVVGDPKQAIYAFRGADVHSYLKACGEMSAAGAPRVPLATNFRSTADLIDACNHIFDQAAESPFFTGEICYRDPATCGLPARKAIDSRGRALKPVTLMRYEYLGASAADARAAIGRHVALTLGRLLAGEQSITIAEPDAKTEEPISRTVRPRDVFVLTRTRRESEEIGGYLREAGVPFAFYKLEGLFQTREAHHVLDVLRAIEDPHDRSRRLRAWASPFFALPHRALATLGDVSTTHPLNERLYEWRVLAESERFADLFNRLLHESGLVDRELFLSDGERELTNYLHVFELLLEQTMAKRLSLAEIIALLEDYTAQRDQPPGPDGNIQRLESERAAVQVMTVHMSKGLEADVVVLYGGTHTGNMRDDFAIYHTGNERRFAIGKLRERIKPELNREEAEENQRLLYVALTRARVKLYLPLLPDGATKTGLNGYYGPLNQRLKQIAARLADSTRGKQPLSALFEIDDVADSVEATASTAVARPPIEWSPPPALLKDNQEAEATFIRLKRAHAPTFMGSYTSLKQAANAASSEITPEDFKIDLESAVEAADLPGGANVGIFLHEVIERLNLDSFKRAADLESWKNRGDVKELFRETMRRNQVREPRWFDRGREIVFNALTMRFAIPRGRMIGPLHVCPSVREMEFVYPIRENAPPSAPAAAEISERGFLKGFVDFVFEQDGLVYFADWKSDLLASYDPHAVEEHVRRNYELQARIYTAGIIRMLRVRDESEYERRFGGLLYVFLRGLRGDGAAPQGLYFHRPQWAEMRQSESALMKLQGIYGVL